ncbi:nitrogenase molybdenum-cofactor synthesis protein NifE [Natranaerovirga hydrolytica]|uniref:Nitrogenase molybdenum-cofactor synthesis protein NifE n=1 Tax=Natranaerovirga hydrolytica TaxID=680378 RepID=A0A4R1MJD2_9FIRM|nr:nitrogenase component 1 [Natranaerovirga hydrolytica]TCK92816.1 nitrogenase molybdenum-cofactor synthesis protein NifE [Natranaerovirga hydrolytica]
MSKTSALAKVSTLNEVKKNEDITSLSHAIFPGTHCPLFGVAMIASFIEDLVVLVAGTQECTYYVKNFVHNRQKGKDNFYSVITDKHDITFGAENKLREVIKEIDETLNPKGIMVVTTCVLELIGEDVEGLGRVLEEEVNAKILVVPTEHFKCNSHIPGMERSLEKLIGLMEKNRVEEKTVNILGHRQVGIEDTELMQVLAKAGITINSVLPSKCTIEKLKNVSKGALNIVTDFIALPLAKQMKDHFNTPYVYFGKPLSLERIKEKYKAIETILNIGILKQLQDKEEELNRLVIETKERLKDKTFIYGNTPMMAFEVASYLCELGLKPELIQVRELYDNDDLFMEEIKSHRYNPYITKIANIAPMEKVYDELKPNLYIGHENPMNLMKRNIVQITLDDVTKKIGYEVPIYALKKILLSYRQQDEMKKKMMAMSKGGVRHGVV